MLRIPLNRFVLSVLLLASIPTGAAVAQGFDASKVDWEKLSKIPMRDGFIKQFNENCGACHGDDLQGAPLGGPLVGVELRQGDSVAEIATSIASGFPDKGMPAWSETLNETQIWNLAFMWRSKGRVRPSSINAQIFRWRFRRGI